MLPIQLTDATLAVFNQSFERTSGCWEWSQSHANTVYGDQWRSALGEVKPQEVPA